jgi:hypothetical protein
MESVEVTARFEKDGRVVPLYLVWQGHRYTIDNTGRQWQASDGWHILTMTASGRMFELVFMAAENRWLLGRVEPHRMLG